MGVTWLIFIGYPSSSRGVGKGLGIGSLLYSFYPFPKWICLRIKLCFSGRQAAIRAM